MIVDSNAAAVFEPAKIYQIPEVLALRRRSPRKKVCLRMQLFVVVRRQVSESSTCWFSNLLGSKTVVCCRVSSVDELLGLSVDYPFRSSNLALTMFLFDSFLKDL